VRSKPSSIPLAVLLAVWIAGAAAAPPRPQQQPAPAAAAGQAPADALARAAELIDAGNPSEAITLLDARLRQSEEPRALLLRSTARFLLGELDPGEKDLRRALELDPSQRQGWLNLAALELASKHYEPAYQAFLRAETLDPKAPDNDVNLGATLLFLGRLEDASARFERYLAAQPNSGDAYYLVATNYAASGYSALALRHLTDAIRRDEKTRLKARTDPNFSQIAVTPDYQRLLATDIFVPPPGSLQASDVIAAPYSDSDTRVVSAILDALGALHIPFDRRVEVTPEWALVWADMRIKVRRQTADQTVIEVSAPPASFTPQAFEQRTRTLFNRARAVILSYRSTSERLHLPNSEPLPP
jgi:tetratricopeptide (TPR) repeat protein